LESEVEAEKGGLFAEVAEAFEEVFPVSVLVVVLAQIAVIFAPFGREWKGSGRGQISGQS